MKITIGICTKDNHYGLNQCLKRLFNQNLPKYLQFELVIIDQSGNISFTKKIIKKYKTIAVKNRTTIIYKRNLKNGISFSRNQLFKIASGEILFSLDDDIVVSKFWIKNGVNFFKKNPKAGVIGGKVIIGRKVPEKDKGHLKQLNFSSNFWPYALYDLGHNILRLDPNIIHYPVFANMAIRKKIYKTVVLNTIFGNQSSFFKVYGGEDPDFIEKAETLTQIFYYPKMLSKHNIKSSRFNKKFFYWKYWEFGKERALLEKIYSKESSISLRRFLVCIKTILLKENDFAEKLHVIFTTSYVLTLCYYRFVTIFKKR